MMQFIALVENVYGYATIIEMHFSGITQYTLPFRHVVDLWLVSDRTGLHVTQRLVVPPITL